MKKLVLYCLLLAIPLVAVTVLATYSDAQQGKNDITQQQRDFSNQFPIVEYDAPLPSAPELLQKRQSKGQRYDGLEFVSVHSDVSTFSSHWAVNIPGLPVSTSDLVIMCWILDSQAFLSNDKGSVYSEFKAEIGEVFFTKVGENFALKEVITTTRMGGRVRFSSGKVSLFYTGGQGMPLPGQKYVLFLKNLAEKDFEIITGYALIDDHVVPLDRPGGGHPFTKYAGLDESSFLIQVRDAANSTNK